MVRPQVLVPAAPGPDLPPATALVLAPILGLVPEPLLLTVLALLTAPLVAMALGPAMVLGPARLPALGLLLTPDQARDERAGEAPVK
jgi:hypothetical protein